MIDSMHFFVAFVVSKPNPNNAAAAFESIRVKAQSSRAYFVVSITGHKQMFVGNC